MKGPESSLKVGRYARLPVYSMIDNFCLTEEGKFKELVHPTKSI